MTNKTTSAIDLVERLDAPTLARKLYEAHAKFHGFSGERWDDEPWQSRHSWLNIAKTALEAIQPADTITRLQAALDEVRAERDALLQKPLDLAKMDSIDEDVPDKMLAYYWWQQAQDARSSVGGE